MGTGDIHWHSTTPFNPDLPRGNPYFVAKFDRTTTGETRGDYHIRRVFRSAAGGWIVFDGLDAIDRPNDYFDYYAEINDPERPTDRLHSGEDETGG